MVYRHKSANATRRRCHIPTLRCLAFVGPLYQHFGVSVWLDNFIPAPARLFRGNGQHNMSGRVVFLVRSTPAVVAGLSS